MGGSWAAQEQARLIPAGRSHHKPGLPCVNRKKSKKAVFTEFQLNTAFRFHNIADYAILP